MANEPKNTLPIGERREPTPDASDEGSSDSDGSTEYESKEPLTPGPQKRPHGEEEDDPDFDLRGETRGSRAEPRVNSLVKDTETRLEVLRQCTLINTAFEGLLQVYN
jgi:hypothetical protein